MGQRPRRASRPSASSSSRTGSSSANARTTRVPCSRRASRRPSAWAAADGVGWSEPDPPQPRRRGAGRGPHHRPGDVHHPRRRDLAVDDPIPEGGLEQASDRLGLPTREQARIPDHRPRIQDDGFDHPRIGSTRVEGPVTAGTQPDQHEPRAETATLELVDDRTHLATDLGRVEIADVRGSGRDPRRRRRSPRGPPGSSRSHARSSAAMSRPTVGWDRSGARRRRSGRRP